MVFLRMLEIVAIFTAIGLFISEILVPMIWGGPLFPLFRRNKRRDELIEELQETDQTIEDLELAKAVVEHREAARKKFEELQAVGGEQEEVKKV